MKREIKFRVWDNLNKSFLKDKSVLIHTEKPFVQHDQGHVFQQYTGLRDKNDVEIYEGDIVKISYEDTDIVGFVFYENDCTAFRVRVSDIHTKLLGGINLLRLKVIGNIFENKDLLK